MRIASACILTVLIECSFFYMTGSRTLFEGIVVLCANVITNLLLNLFLTVTGLYDPVTLLLLETAAVISEYFIFRYAFKKQRDTFLRTLVANLLSFSIGLVLF